MKKIVKYILALTLLSINALFLITVIVIWKPQIIMNEKVANKIVEHFSNDDFKISWKLLSLNIQSQSFLEKKVDIVLTDSCVVSKAIRGCFQDLAISVGFKIQKPLLITTLGPLRIKSSEIVYNQQPPKNKRKSLFPYRNWIDLSKVKLDKSGVMVSYWQVNLLNHTSHEGSFNFTTNDKKGLSDFFTELIVTKSSWVESLTVTSQTNNSEEDISGLWKGKINVDLKLPRKNNQEGLKGSINGSLSQKKLNSLNLDFIIKGEVRPKPKSQVIDFFITGDYENKKITSTLTSTIKTGISSVPKLQFQKCSFGFEQIVKENAKASKIDLDCKVLADIVLPIPAEAPDLELPKSTGLQVTAHVETSFPPSLNKKILGNANFVLDPILTPLFKGDGNAQIKFSGIPKEYKEMIIDGQGDINVSITNFQEVVNKFEKTSWAIPAPLNTLSGNVDAGIKGAFDLNQGLFPVYLNTKLASNYQTVIINTAGDVYLNIATLLLKKQNINKLSKIRLEIGLDDVILALPRLKLEKPPPLIPDRRFEKAVSDTVKKMGFEYDIRFFTKDNPIRLISNLAKLPVPISIDIKKTTTTPLIGKIAIGNFPVELFKRKGRVDRLIISLVGKEAPKLDGEIFIDYTDYNIKISLQGTTDKPIVNIASNPPLSDEQVISVLIFGRTIDELDAGQQESVGNTQSALADGTVGLASLYLLASTPIESLGYDPESGQVTAKLRIADGTSLNLGTNRAGQETIGVRRRLNKNLVITTDYKNSGGSSSSSTTTESNEVNAFLEWTKRY